MVEAGDPRRTCDRQEGGSGTSFLCSAPSCLSLVVAGGTHLVGSNGHLLGELFSDRQNDDQHQTEPGGREHREQQDTGSK